MLGYSLGGMVAQQLAANHPDLVRRLVLVGTAPQGGEEHLMTVLADARSQKDIPDTRLDLFFTKSEASRAAGLAYLARIKRKIDPDPPRPRKCKRSGKSADLFVRHQGCEQFDPRHDPSPCADRKPER